LTSTTLIRRVQADEPRAWEQFVELYGPLLFYWSRRAGLSSADAADVTQEAFAAIAKSVARFDFRNGDGSFRGWLWTIVQNKLQDFYRKRPAVQGAGGTDFLRRLQEWPEPLSVDGDDGTQQAELKSLVQRALFQVEAEFERHTWTAFWNVVVDGRATLDVAAELGISPCSVRQAKSRVLRRLRAHLAGWIPE
jgi:RNA polymerase sigma-70 factor (ECF subfamily)